MRREVAIGFDHTGDNVPVAKIYLTSPDPITFRPAALSDEATLWEMLYHALYVPEGSPAPDRDVLLQPALARYVRDWGKAGDLGCVAVSTRLERPVGAAWLRLFTVDNAGYGYVDDDTPELSIAVLPEFRGRGIGAQLMIDLIGAASKEFVAISLSVQRENPALRLYRRLGFEEVSSSGTSLVMKKTLSRGVTGDHLPPGGGP